MFPSSVENLSQTREWTYTIEGRSSQAGHDRQALGLFLQKYVSNFHCADPFYGGRWRGEATGSTYPSREEYMWQELIAHCHSEMK